MSGNSAKKDEAFYGQLLQHMLMFHNGFRREYATIVQEVAEVPRSNKPQQLLQRIMQRLLQLCQHLDMHHMIEEAHIFPVLARRIAAFKKDAEHHGEHAQMHAALIELEKYASKLLRELHSSSARDRAQIDALFDPDAFTVLLKRLETALFPHLQAEEENISAANLIKYGVTRDELMNVLV